MRTLKDTCGFSVNITLRAEFSPVKAGKWGFTDLRTGQYATTGLGAQVDQVEIVGGDPNENPVSSGHLDLAPEDLDLYSSWFNT